MSLLRTFTRVSKAVLSRLEITLLIPFKIRDIVSEAWSSFILLKI